jgi:hypothetical protein
MLSETNGKLESTSLVAAVLWKIRNGQHVMNDPWHIPGHINSGPAPCCQIGQWMTASTAEPGLPSVIHEGQLQSPAANCIVMFL